MISIAIIPARMGASRFPGKPLARLLGRPMIEHVYERTVLCRSLSKVYVATCDEEIRDAVEGFGGNVIMTSDRHERASERVAEAAANLTFDVAVMVQGDEPMIHPDMIDEAIAPMEKDVSIACVNLTSRIESEEEFLSPNTIKVVMDSRGRALYMSRQPIPDRPKGDFSRITAFKQVCIIPFRRDALAHFAALAPTPLETSESIDMMRFIENGIAVQMAETKFSSHAVDTPEDLALVADLMRVDPLLKNYEKQIS